MSFMRTYFANNHVRRFSVSVWVNRQVFSAGIVNNGDCKDNASFGLDLVNGGVQGAVRTDRSGLTILPPYSVSYQIDIAHANT